MDMAGQFCNQRGSFTVTISGRQRVYRRTTQHERHLRRGILLPVVMAVAVLWAFAALHFSESMVHHATISMRIVNEICVRQGVFSSLSWLEGISELPEWGTQSGRVESQLYRGIHNGSERSAMVFSIASRQPQDAFGRESFVFGLDDESARLDINWLASQKGDQRSRLLLIPQMTPALADSLLDWIDSDHEPREFGAERNYYLSRNSPELPPNGPVDRLSDLLHVRGITRELLLGPQNAALESRSNSLEDPIKGDRETGFARYLTTNAAEAEYKKSDLIPVNTDDLVLLFDELKKRLGEEPARFIVAVRIAGIVERSANADGEDNQRSLRDRLNEQLRTSPRSPDRKADGSEASGGLDLSRAAQFRIYSPWELLGTHVRILMGGQDVVLKSPWEGTASKIPDALKLLRKHMDFRSFGKPLRGRLNINAAPEELLSGLPGMNPLRVRKLISVRERHLRQASAAGEDPFLWLLTEDVLSLEELRKLSRWITARGDILTGTVHVFSPSYGPVYRCQVRLDRTGSSPAAFVTGILSPLPASYRPQLMP